MCAIAPAADESRQCSGLSQSHSVSQKLNCTCAIIKDVIIVHVQL